MPEIKPWNAEKIRYIKLGPKGAWWRHCLEASNIVLGFNSGHQEIYKAAREGKWDLIRSYWIQQGVGTPTHHTNQMREFFCDSGKTLWFTFESGCLYYAFSDSTGVRTGLNLAGDSSVSFLNVSKEGWRNTDKNGKELRIESLSGNLTKTAGYRQTICSLNQSAEAYLRLRLEGKTPELLGAAENAKSGLELAIKPIIQSLKPEEFELLVELIFSASGWKRTIKTGGTYKHSDLELINPITKDMIWVQVKSSLKKSDLKRYQGIYDSSKDTFSSLYYVFHTTLQEFEPEDDRIIFWDIDELAKQSVSNGLVDWLLMKAR